MIRISVPYPWQWIELRVRLRVELLLWLGMEKWMIDIVTCSVGSLWHGDLIVAGRSIQTLFSCLPVSMVVRTFRPWDCDPTALSIRWISHHNKYERWGYPSIVHCIVLSIPVGVGDVGAGLVRENESLIHFHSRTYNPWDLWSLLYGYVPRFVHCCWLRLVKASFRGWRCEEEDEHRRRQQQRVIMTRTRDVVSCSLGWLTL